MLAKLFYYPITLPYYGQIWMLLPLLVAVAVVYKAARSRHIRDVPKETAITLAYMFVGLLALSVVLWLLTEYWP
ncbi:MAG: hypothetical protein ACLFUJ_08535 [Phycisphaerae bacterium]